MTKKLSKLSLKEFYEHHGSKNAISCLPTKPGDVGGADQGFNNRLADLSIDCRSTGNGHSNYGSYSSGPSAGGHLPAHGSSYSRWPHPHAGPYPGAPPAGGPGPAGPRSPAGPGAAAMGNGGSFDAPHAYPGPYSHPSSRPGPYASGPYHGPPPAAPAAGEDVWYPPPPPPPPRASLNSQQLPAAAAAAAAGERGAACGEGPAAPATATGRSARAPPPPPRKQVEQMQLAQGQAQSAAGPAGDGLARAVAPGAAGDAAAAKSAMVAQQLAATELERARKPEVGEHAKAATPFASAPAAAPAAAAPAAAACPKNEFAEKLAQKAMASAARAKSSLLAGGSSSGSRSSALSGGRMEVLGGEDGGGAGEQCGAFVKPAHPFGRPRLLLKPRSAVADSSASTPTAQGGNSSSASSDSGTDLEHSSGSIASSGAGCRPRLQPLADDGTSAAGAAQHASGRPRLSLLPRGSSTGPDRQGSSNGSTADGEGAVRKPSVFGAAKPREEVLKGRGEDAMLVEAGLSRSAGSGAHRLSEAAVARLGNGGSGSGRWGGSHGSVSGGDDEWQTVSAHGRKVSSSKYNEAGGSSALLLGDDPFFGSSSGGGSGYTGGVSAPRAFERDIMRDGRAYGRSGGSYDEGGYGSYGSRKGGLYGSPAGRWGGKGYGGGVDDAEGDVDGGVFGRALPTRQTPLAF